MFARLGSFAVRFRWFIIAAWVVVAAVLTLVGPNIDDVAVSDQRAFLPSSAPSLDANEIGQEVLPRPGVALERGAGRRRRGREPSGRGTGRRVRGTTSPPG